jgi:flagellar biosynthetic protein FliP
MTTSTTPTTSTTQTRRILARPYVRFTVHFAEMFIAMIVGMVALGPLWSLAWPGLDSYPAGETMVMATNMTIGMVLWMRIRRHAWRPIVEMSAAMYLPFVLLLVPYLLGAVSGGVLMMGGHILMGPFMLAAMLLRRREYSGGHH